MYKFFVKHGAKLLDQISPLWFEEVNADEINMADPYSCVLGQAFDSYIRGQRQLGIYRGWPYGFEVVPIGSRSTASKAYQKLDELWKDEVIKRIAK